MTFERAFDLNNNVIRCVCVCVSYQLPSDRCPPHWGRLTGGRSSRRMGPLTLVTVDSGYSAVTEDNGEQKARP